MLPVPSAIRKNGDWRDFKAPSFNSIILPLGKGEDSSIKGTWSRVLGAGVASSFATVGRVVFLTMTNWWSSESEAPAEVWTDNSEELSLLSGGVNSELEADDEGIAPRARRRYPSVWCSTMTAGGQGRWCRKQWPSSQWLWCINTNFGWHRVMRKLRYVDTSVFGDTLRHHLERPGSGMRCCLRPITGVFTVWIDVLGFCSFRITAGTWSDGGSDTLGPPERTRAKTTLLILRNFKAEH